MTKLQTFPKLDLSWISKFITMEHAPTINPRAIYQVNLSKKEI